MAGRRAPQINVFETYPTLDLDIDNVVLPQCTFADVDEMYSSVSHAGFSLLLFNIRNCRKYFLDFSSYFQEYFCKYSCIVLTETWLTADYGELFQIHGFKNYDLYRSQYGGGIRMYVKNNVDIKILTDNTFVSNLYEMLSVEVMSVNSKFILCAIYHPPTADHNINNMFNEDCCDKINTMRNTGLPVVVCGDFNLNLLNPLRLNYISSFIDSMLEVGLYPGITIPTKYNSENFNTRFALIDQVWASSPSIMTHSYVIPVGLTDHFPVVTNFTFSVCEDEIPLLSRRVFNHQNNQIFTNLLSQIRPLLFDDLNDSFNYYFFKVYEAYDSAYPITTNNINSVRRCPWITPQIRTCIKKKSRLYRMYTRGTIGKIDYTVYKNRLTLLLRRVRRLYYYKLFVRIRNDSKRVWSHLNNIISPCTRIQMEKLYVEPLSLTGQDMVNYANSHFVNMANNLTAGLQGYEYYNFVTEPNPSTCGIFLCDAREVGKVIKSLKNKGSGMHDIGIRSIKNNLGIFSEHLSVLYNFSIEKETYPDLLKIAAVVPGHKAGAKDNIDNYRPISNLPVCSKIFEKLTLNRYTSFANRHSLLNENQFGFQKGKNITQAAVKLTTLITKAYHNKRYAACFFLDLKKAFDTLDHNILLEKLNHMGYRGTSNRYMASYLENRQQYTQVGNFKSSMLSISKGVPQGSILGPFLFCLYINDIFDVVDVEVVMFADDAAFFVSAAKLDLLYEGIKKLFDDLSTYLNNNKLIPNLQKSKLMYFLSRPYPSAGLETIYFRNEAIEWVTEYKYLGLTLTNRMSYALHIDRVLTRISRYIGVFYCLNKMLPLSVLMLLYHSLVVPHMFLHIELWGAAQDVYINKLVIKQNKVLRAILDIAVVNGRPAVETNRMYSDLNVLTLRNIFKLQLFKFLISLLKGELPLFYNLLLQPLHSLHQYHTRGGVYRHPLVTCEVERRAISHQMILLMEDVNIEQYRSQSVKAASMNFKKFLLSRQIT